MPKFVKGSPEAKEHMRKIREKRGQPKPEGYVPKAPKQKKEKKEDEVVDLTTFGEPTLTIPEFFVVERHITHKTGEKVGQTEIKYQLVNPLTKSRNLATRKGKPSITILRKPIKNDFIHLSHKPTEPIPLSLFSTKDRDTIRRNFDMLEKHKDREFKDLPILGFNNKPRGRPEILPLNVAHNLDAKKYPPINTDFNFTNYDDKIYDDTLKIVDQYKKKQRKYTEYTSNDPNVKKLKKHLKAEQQKQQKQQKPKEEIRYKVVDRPTQQQQQEETKTEEEPPVINYQNAQPIKRKREPLANLTPEEKALRLKQQKAESARKIYEAKKQKQQEGKGIGSPQYEGYGVLSSISKGIKKTTKKITDYGRAVIYGRNDYPPKVRNILDQYGDKIVRGIRIKRTPVPALFTHILGAISQSFSNNMSNAPFDELYHLYIGVSLDDGSIVSIEKNEVINMDINPQTRPETDELIVIPIPPNMTILTMMEATHKYMGKKFYTYSAKNNNCQDFILAIFDANQIGDEDDRAFIKQDTKTLFSNTGGLSKITDTITNLGSAFNSFTQGAGIIDEYGNMVNHLTKHITDPTEPIDPQDYAQATHLIKKIKHIKMGSPPYDADNECDSGSDDEMKGGKIETITPSYVVQSVIFDMPKYEVASAVRWLKHNGLKALKADIEEGQTTESINRHTKLNPAKHLDIPPTEKKGTIRFRQMSPTEVKKKGYTQYRTKPLGKDSGITLLLAYKEAGMTGGELFISPEPEPTRWVPHMNEGVINKRSMTGGRLVKGSPEAKEYMRKMREKRGKK